jgi:hypothetical protein
MDRRRRTGSWGGRTQRYGPSLPFLLVTLPFLQPSSQTFDKGRPSPPDGRRVTLFMVMSPSKRVVGSVGFDGRVWELVHGSKRSGHGSFQGFTLVPLAGREGHDADPFRTAGPGGHFGTDRDLHLH